MRWNARTPSEAAGSRPIYGRILVIDDEPDIGEALAEVLQYLGARAVVVTSAASARRALACCHYDVIVSDVAMPEESGIDFIRALRAHPDLAVRDTPAVAVSAHCSPRNQDEALVAGFDRFVAKPYGIDDIRGALLGLISEEVRRISRREKS